MLKGLFFFGCILFLSLCCSYNKNSNPANQLFELAENTGISFINKVTATKEFNIFNYRNFYNGGGCAIGDLNNDGLADVYFTSNQGSNKLYFNKGGFLFEDRTSSSNVSDSLSWSTGVTMVDINADGWLDIYVCNAGYINGITPQSKLYINNHDFTFTEKAAAYNLENKGGYATHAAFFDYDNDDDLDCFIVNNSFIPTNTLNYENKRNLRAKDWPVKSFLKGGGDRLLKNNNGVFEDVSEKTGIYGSLISFGLGVTIGDINDDGWLDVYVSNDFFERDYLYINQQDGSFKDQLTNYVEHVSHSSMGADMADVNNDGLTDIFVTEMLPDNDHRLKTTTSFENIDVNRQKIKSGFYHQYMQNTLQINNGNGKFYESAFYSGVAASDWSWGGLIFDADNDSHSDIYVCNGIYKDVTDQDFIDFFADDVYQKMAMSGTKSNVDDIIKKMPSVPLSNKMFANAGNLRFKDKALAWGLATPSFSNGAAYGDLDNDGDLDLIVNNVNQPAFVYKNKSSQLTNNHYLGVSLKGNAANTFAIGSKVKLYAGSKIISRELLPSRGFQSSVDYKIIMGLGAVSSIDSLIIIWPNKTYSKVNRPPLDTIINFQQPTIGKPFQFLKPAVTPFFDIVKTSFARHIEDDYIDFYTERNIPAMISREGPKAAVGDVNGDKLDDIYIPAGAGNEAQLYLQSKAGGYIKKETIAFKNDAVAEGVCAIFFDADKDGDVDLVTGSGGNNRPANSDAYNTHLYFNDGKGAFTSAKIALPSSGNNTSCIAANDFDKDGDIDLFVGSRGIPGAYGETPVSQLLINDGFGVFSKATLTIAGPLTNAGMITGAVWCNLNDKLTKDLVLTGEWMAPRVFKYNGKTFKEQTTNLQQLNGLWQTITACDTDNDGDDDLLLGNIGENLYLNPTEKMPVKLWVFDFDNNGTKDKIITHTVSNRDMPVFTKKDLTEQLPILKKQNLKHAVYANKSLSDLFPLVNIDKILFKTFNYSAHCVATNNGNGNFSITKLPWQVQLSCVNTILANDINADGTPDLLIGSNKYNFLPQFCRLDAAFGIVLLNTGKNGFVFLNNNLSGINIQGCVKDIKMVSTNSGLNYLWLINDNYPIMMKPYSSFK